MIKLYGLRMSNYFSLTKALLIEKGVAFEEVKMPPSQKEEFLRLSPMGKMPAIEVDGAFLSESLAIADYLERIAPNPALLPTDPFAAAKVMELVCHTKFKQPVSEETKSSVRAGLEQGMASLDRIFVGAPYAAGDTLTLADFYTYYCFGLGSGMAKTIYDMDLLEGYPKIAAVIEKMAEHPSVKQVEAEKAA